MKKMIKGDRYVPEPLREFLEEKARQKADQKSKYNTKMYAIGRPDRDNDIALYNGPNPSRKVMLDIVPDGNGDVLVGFYRGRRKILFVYDDNAWIKQ